MSTGSPRAKSKVYLVDDHPLVREWLSILINQQPGLEICGEADSAADALDGIARHKPQVVIADISLRNSGGLDLIKDIKERFPEIAVLVLSMHEETLYAERALRAGACGYIMKRESTGKVVEAVHRLLEGKLYVSPDVSELMTRKVMPGKNVRAVGASVTELSDRELEVFEMLGRGLGTRQIAERLGVSIKTVQAYCARIKDKLRLDNATELLREAIRWTESIDLK